jgi:hypothetical protein
MLTGLHWVDSATLISERTKYKVLQSEAASLIFLSVAVYVHNDVSSRINLGELNKVLGR